IGLKARERFLVAPVWALGKPCSEIPRVIEPGVVGSVDPSHRFRHLRARNCLAERWVLVSFVLTRGQGAGPTPGRSAEQRGVASLVEGLKRADQLFAPIPPFR